MSSIVSQTDINKLLAENPYLQFGGVQQQPTSLIQNMMASAPGWMGGATPEAQAPTNYLMTENFPGMEPRNIAEYQIAPGASNTANLMSAGANTGPSFEQTNTIADTLYKDGKFSDKDYTSELQTLSGGGSTISNQAWRGFLDSLNYVEEQQLKQYLTGKGVADTTPYLSYDESRIPESVLSSLKSAGMGSLGDAMAQYGTSGKKGQAIAPGVQGPFSPWMSDEEKQSITDAINTWVNQNQILAGERGDSVWDTIAKAMTKSLAVGVTSAVPGGKVLGPLTAAAIFGAETDYKGGSTSDILKSAIPAAVLTYIGASAASGAGGGAGGAASSGGEEAAGSFLSSLGKKLLTSAITSGAASVLSGGKNTAPLNLGTVSLDTAAQEQANTNTAQASTIAESLSNSTGANAGIANILEQLAVMNAGRGGGNIKRMLKLAGIE